MMIAKEIAEILCIGEEQARNTIDLIKDGNTIPFIARYRKEMTGNLDDTILRAFEKEYDSILKREQRRESVLKSLEEKGVEQKILTSIKKAISLQEIEDLYAPYKTKRKTRADRALEQGLGPLAQFIKTNASTEKINQKAIEFVTEEISNVQALEGAGDILAQELSQSPQAKNILREDIKKRGILEVEIKDDPEGTYSFYDGFKARVKQLRPHQILAIFRGEKQKKLRIIVAMSDEYNLLQLRKIFPTQSEFLDQIILDGYKRLLKPAIERELVSELKEYAQDASIGVFQENLIPYLMQAPIQEKVILGLDPGYRTGCKVAVIDEKSQVRETGVLYISASEAQKQKEAEYLKKIIEKNRVDVIAIGNGTASRETEEFVAKTLQEIKREVTYAIINEAGASIYSASKLASEEFPEYDVSIRGAISIARRLQDPLAELIKISPEHLGIGQYQHDLDQKKLNESLEQTVIDCVNRVGVNLNQASWKLLSYVSGLSEKLAKEIERTKEEKNGFHSIFEIKEVKGLGEKTFIQCAGFLRIPESEDLLDHTGVHPENYEVARKILKGEEVSVEDVGAFTLEDIQEELKKPGRDFREMSPKPIFRKDIISFDDLKVGQVLLGNVRNVVDFGAFVDIGVKVDGLIHTSKMPKEYRVNPRKNLKIGDIVETEIIDVDADKQRISLSLNKVQ